MSNTTITGRVSGRMSSRGWAIALGLGAIVVAAILLIVYLDRYRDRVASENAPTPALVANRLIPKGTPGSVAGTNGMYTSTTLPAKEVTVGAVTDASYLTGRAAAVDVLPGTQITAAHFAASDTGTVKAQLRGTERALSISVDAVHGSLSQLQSGDSIDLYVATGGRAGGQGLVKLFEPNVKVLTIPTQPGPSGGGNLVLKVDTRDAARFAYAADNTQFYFVLRPAVGAKRTIPSTATIDSVLR
jgi:Flp pilus assembly protein CpaB